MYFYGPPHMDVQKQDDQHEHTFSSYVRKRDVVLKTYQGRWPIGRDLFLSNTINSIYSSSFVCTHLNGSLSSCHAISTDISDPLSPHLPIVHCFRQILRATFHMGQELLYAGSNWTFCLCSSIWRGPLEYITHELVPTSPVVYLVSGLSNFDSFRNGW